MYFVASSGEMTTACPLLEAPVNFCGMQHGAGGGSNHDAFGAGQADAGFVGVAVFNGDDVVNQRVIQDLGLMLLRQVGDFLDAGELVLPVMPVQRR